MPVEVMQVFIKELMAQTRQQATQETARNLQSPTGGFCKEVAQGAQEPQQQPDGLGCKGEEYSMVVDNQEFGREEAVGAGALDGHKVGGFDSVSSVPKSHPKRQHRYRVE